MSMTEELICTNCGDNCFVVLYDLAMGSIEDTQTNFELLKCMNCGQLQNQKFETTR